MVRTHSYTYLWEILWNLTSKEFKISDVAIIQQNSAYNKALIYMFGYVIGSQFPKQ